MLHLLRMWAWWKTQKTRTGERKDIGHIGLAMSHDITQSGASPAIQMHLHKKELALMVAVNKEFSGIPFPLVLQAGKDGG